MAKLGRNRIVAEVTAPQNGTGAGDTKPGERHCALCGQQSGAEGAAIERFGEAFCTEAHAETFVEEVRTARVQAAAAAVPVTTQVERPDAAGPEAAREASWKGLLKMGLCCGAPLLVLALLAGGGAMVLGAAGAILPALAMLACPLGMYFMMRSMSKTGDQGNSKDKGADR